jgi:hypothetical protein
MGIQTVNRAFVALLLGGIDSFEKEFRANTGRDLDNKEREVVAKIYDTIKRLEEQGLNGSFLSLLVNGILTILSAEKKFDLVLGNLPWVNISSYPKEYGETLKDVTKSLGMYPPGQAGKKLDVSVPLFAIATWYLLDNNGVAGLMMPISIFRGLHGDGFRRYLRTKLRLMEVFDLEEVKPFEGAENQPGIVFALKKKSESNENEDEDVKLFKYFKFSGLRLSPENLSNREPTITDILEFWRNNKLNIDKILYVSVSVANETLWLSKETYDIAKSVFGDGNVYGNKAREGASFDVARGAWRIVDAPKPVKSPPGIEDKCVLVETILSRSLGLEPFIVAKPSLAISPGIFIPALSMASFPSSNSPL